MGIITNNFIFFALAKSGEGISGSDRIFIELARVWSKNHVIKIITSSEGSKLCKIQKLDSKNVTIDKINNENYTSNFFVNYVYKILKGIFIGLQLGIENGTFLYSASEFWMDSLPAVIAKLRNPKLIWIATWYQTAPNPLKGFTEGGREKKYNFSALLYWVMQKPIMPLIKRMADFVIVNNEDERKQFAMLNAKKRVRVLIGAVRLEEIRKWQLNNKSATKIYDGVFQGRFHPQKGVVELVEIWKKVVDRLPSAQLAMIGDGPLMGDVRREIQKLGLIKNIKLFGYVYDGDKKYKIFSQSKLVLHPAFYDSGGMATAEAMAFGLPAVGFNLKSYESYYPKGMFKVKIGDLDSFSDTILELLKNEEKRNSLGKIARITIEKSWSWEKRARDLYESLDSINN